MTGDTDAAENDENKVIVQAFVTCVKNLLLKLCSIFAEIYIGKSAKLTRSEQRVRYDTEMYALLQNDKSTSVHKLKDLFAPLKSFNGRMGVADFVASKLYLACTLDVAERMFTKSVSEGLKALEIANAGVVPSNGDPLLPPNDKDVLRDEVVFSGWALASELKVVKREEGRRLQKDDGKWKLPTQLRRYRVDTNKGGGIGGNGGKTSKKAASSSDMFP